MQTKLKFFLFSVVFSIASINSSFAQVGGAGGSDELQFLTNTPQKAIVLSINQFLLNPKNQQETMEKRQFPKEVVSEKSRLITLNLLRVKVQDKHRKKEKAIAPKG